MEVMHPKKGPAWANDATMAESSVAGPSKQVPTSMDVDGPAQEGLSDLEWLKQRTSGNVDTVEKAFEQDDEDAPVRPLS